MHPVQFPCSEGLRIAKAMQLFSLQNCSLIRIAALSHCIKMPCHRKTTRSETMSRRCSAPSCTAWTRITMPLRIVAKQSRSLPCHCATVHCFAPRITVLYFALPQLIAAMPYHSSSYRRVAAALHYSHIIAFAQQNFSLQYQCYPSLCNTSAIPCRALRLLCAAAQYQTLPHFAKAIRKHAMPLRAHVLPCNCDSIPALPRRSYSIRNYANASLCYTLLCHHSAWQYKTSACQVYPRRLNTPSSSGFFL